VYTAAKLVGVNSYHFLEIETELLKALKFNVGLSFAQYKAKVGVLNKIVLARKAQQNVVSEVCLT